MSTATNIFISFMLVTLIVGYSAAHPPVYAESSVAPSTPSPTPFIVPSDIKGYITYKFGPDAPKAFQVLQGIGPGSCAENRNLDPNQDNDNTVWGGIGKDIGYWQINTVFHPGISEWCARNVRCSTDYAYKLFVAAGNKFTAWTCGKVYAL